MGAPLNTIIVDSAVRILSFSSGGSFLETDRELLPLGGLEGHYPLGISPRPVSRPQVFLDGNWVLRNSEELFWLPPEYRAAGRLLEVILLR